MSSTTNTSLGADAWVIDDDIERLREWGTDRTYQLPNSADAQVTLGASEACSLQLTDPSGQLSRQHARMSREPMWTAGSGNPRWVVVDLDSKNGTWLNGSRRPKFVLEPGGELGVGGITLIAESPRLVALRGFLARLLGWSADRSDTVDLAVRSVRMSATHHAALALCADSDGELLPIARGLHRFALGGERPFVVCDPKRREAEGESYISGVAALRAAASGTMCIWAKRLPRDFRELMAELRGPSTRVQLIACGQRPSDRTDLASAPIEIPPLSARTAELDRIIDEYAEDAAALLRVTTPFSKADRAWVRTQSAESFAEVDKGTARIVALREAGNVMRAAGMLGMAHASLNEWIRRRRLPPGILR